MKFFYFTQISNSPSLYWASLDDVQDIPEPFHRLFAQYSKLHIQQPRNDAPNISASEWGIHFEESVKCDLLTASPSYSHSTKVDIQYVREHDPYSQLPLESEHSLRCKSGLSNHAFVAEHLLGEHDNDTSSPKQDEPKVCLHYGLSCDIQPCCKAINFIETKVAAIKLQGFNH